jgi:hypothetical protein
VKVLLIGLGRWGEKHLRVLGELGCEVWVADLSAERRAFAVKAGVPKRTAVTDFRSALPHGRRRPRHARGQPPGARQRCLRDGTDRCGGCRRRSSRGGELRSQLVARSASEPGPAGSLDEPVGLGAGPR